MWDVHTQPEVWQALLPQVLDFNLSPAQPLLDALAQPVPPGSTAMAVLDAAYDALLSAITAGCHAVVGKKMTTARNVRWFTYPGVWPAYTAQRTAARAHQRNPTPGTRLALFTARQAWRKVSKEAKAHTTAELYRTIAKPEGAKLMWSQFRRTATSPFTSLAAVVDANNQLPRSRAAALTNVAAAFIHNSQPPAPPADAVRYAAIHQQVSSWGDAVNPTTPAHCSNVWTFTTADVKAQCTSQHTNTAPGPDAILPLFLKHAGHAIWSALADIYTFSWVHSITPQSWREANVMALYKNSGDRANPSSYRPISMTAIIIRTFEHLVHHRLVKLLEPPALAEPYLAGLQFGFRTGRTTTDAIHYLLSSVQQVLRLEMPGPKSQCPVLFLDLKKAFDRVDHNLLLHRLHAAGIQGKAWLWIRSFLSHRRMRVVDAAESSDWLPVEYGVPQGCVLSPLLFLIFINDLVVSISKDPNCRLLRPLFFADDGALVPNPHAATGPVADYPKRYLQQLQHALTLLDQWCVDSRMEFGRDKTQLLVFTGQQKPITTMYQGLQLCGFTIGLTQQYTYLGVIVEHKLSWTQHFTYALARARQAAARITRTALLSDAAHLPAIRSLVLGYLIPRFAYGCLFWGCRLDEVAATALQACVARPLRAALSLPTTTHQLGVLHLTGVPTVDSLVLKAELSHALRVSGLPADHPTKLLHDHCLSRIPAGAKPHVVLPPGKSLSTAVHLATNTLPVTFHDAKLVNRLDTTTRNTLQSSTLDGATWRLGEDIWVKERWGDGITQRQWAQTKYTASALQRTLHWATSAITRLTAPIIQKLTRRKSVQQWEDQHASNQAIAHATTAPLTTCKPSYGLAPYFAHDSRAQAVRRSRLLMGRSFTQSVRYRFPKANAPPPAYECTFNLCQPSDPLVATPADTIDHVLLRCRRHDAARATLCSALAPLFTKAGALAPAPPPLTVSTILCASLPPPPFEPSKLTTLLSCTNAFLDRVGVERAADISLLPFDPG